MSPAARQLLEAMEIRVFLEAELENRTPEWLRNAFNQAEAVCRLRAAVVIAGVQTETQVFGKALCV